LPADSAIRTAFALEQQSRCVTVAGRGHGSRSALNWRGRRQHPVGRGCGSDSVLLYVRPPSGAVLLLLLSQGTAPENEAPWLCRRRFLVGITGRVHPFSGLTSPEVEALSIVSAMIAASQPWRRAPGGGYGRRNSSCETCRNGTIRYTAIPKYNATATSGRTSPMRIEITYPITTGRSLRRGPCPSSPSPCGE
jgi:hypothetical protein